MNNTDGTVSVQFTQGALQEIQEMNYACNRAESALGGDNPYVRKMIDSLARYMTQLVNLGGEIWRDGNLGVAGTTSYGMTYGMVPHRVSLEKLYHQMQLVAPSNLTMEQYGEILDANNVVVVEWSIHS